MQEMTPYLSASLGPTVPNTESSVCASQRARHELFAGHVWVLRNTRSESRSEMPVSCFDVLRRSTSKPEPPAAM